MALVVADECLCCSLKFALLFLPLVPYLGSVSLRLMADGGVIIVAYGWL